MAKALLTDAEIRAAIRSAPKDKLLGDGGGLSLRLRTGREPTWILRYSYLGQKRKPSLGTYPTLTLALARTKADEMRLMLKSGRDPMSEQEQAKALKKAELAADRPPATLRELFTQWRELYLASNHSDGGIYVTRQFDNYVLPVIGDVDPALLRVGHVIKVLDKAAAAGVSRTCGVLLSNQRQLFAWAVQRQWMPGDPTAGLKRRQWGGQVKKRTRNLATDEIKALAKALPAADLSDRYQAAIWLILATGTRVAETLLARTSDVDLDARTWTIPAQHQKKTNTDSPPTDHVIYLSSFAAAQMRILLADAEHDGHQQGFLFPAARRLGPLNEKALTKQIKDRQRVDGKPLPGRTKMCKSLILAGGTWTPHDLRRTAATQMGELEHVPGVIDRCLNHAQSDELRATYQHQELRDAMRHAWNTWGRRLERLVAEAKSELREA